MQHSWRNIRVYEVDIYLTRHLISSWCLGFHSAERAAKTMPREECHGFAHVPRHETPLKKHTKTASYAGYVALYFYDSYEIAVIVVIALAKY